MSLAPFGLNLFWSTNILMPVTNSNKNENWWIINSFISINLIFLSSYCAVEKWCHVASAHQCLHHVGSLQSEALDRLEHIQDALCLHPLQDRAQCTECARPASTSATHTNTHIETLKNQLNYAKVTYQSLISLSSCYWHTAGSHPTGSYRFNGKPTKYWSGHVWLHC